MATESMSRLNTAVSFHCKAAIDDQTPVKVIYKTGASFEGKVEDYKKTGSGVFIWPDGSKYDGDYVNNLRHGKGAQTWADQSHYEGGFVSDLRHGQGSIHWANGESYKGSFFKDRRHGKGSYSWTNGSTFTGTFYMDKKEGYGVFTFANGNQFEGLYKDDEREGPGVMSYKDGKQDVGFWHGERLCRLLTAVPQAFTMADHPDIHYHPEDMTVPITPLPDSTEPIKNILQPPALFHYAPEVKLTKRISELYSEDLDPRSLAVDRQAFDEEFFKNEPCLEKTPEPSTLLVWNKSPMLVDLQMHTHRHRKAAQSVGFAVNKILNFNRSTFKPAGPLEQASEELIKMATAGNFLRVEELLNGGSVHPDVADCQGHTALIAATVNWHLDTINILLNHGADVNQLNDEGVSALAAGTIFYYPVESFLYNIAERDVVKPQLEETHSEPALSLSRSQLATPVLNAATTSLSKAERRASQLNQLNRKKSEMAALKISRDANNKESTIKEAENRPEEEEKEEKSDAPKTETALRKKDSRVVLSEIEPVKITVAKTQRSQLRKGEEEQRVDNFKGSVMSDDDRTSLYDGGDRDGGWGDLTNRSRGERRGGGEGGEEDDDLDGGGIGGRGEGLRGRQGRLLRLSARGGRLGEDFESNVSVRDYQIEVTDALLERCATQLSMNERVVSRMADNGSIGRARMLAIQISQHERMKDTLELLLKRGANPNSSRVPMPVLFFAIKSADVDMVRTLLIKGASTAARLSEEKGGLSPLHIAVAIPGEEGVAITELLLDALADPDARATLDDSFLNTTLEEEWSKDSVPEESRELLGGRTPLQIACARDDHYRNACKVVQLLLKHKANPNLMCNGFSALTLAITSGNDMAIEELLAYLANPSLPLTHGVGSALCVASSTEYEHRRNIDNRIKLIDQLVKAGADILAPIPIGPRRVVGTAVDYAYYMFNQDRRIAHMPYHALTHAERETYNARRRLLAHIGDILRVKAVEQEKRRLIDEDENGVRSLSPSSSFVYTGAGATLPAGVKVSKAGVKPSQVTFEPGPKDGKKGSDSEIVPSVRKPLFKYCYDCGRSVGVRLSACTRCKEVFYCSKACKLKAWNARHKEECMRVGGRSPSPKEGGKTKRTESPKNTRINLDCVPSSRPSASAQEGNRTLSTHNASSGKDRKGFNSQTASCAKDRRGPLGSQQTMSAKARRGPLGSQQTMSAKARARLRTLNSQHLPQIFTGLARRGNGSGHMVQAQGDQRRVQSSSILERGHRFETEGGRLVYRDNYSFN